MQRYFHFAAVVLACVVSQASLAADFDGSKLLICAPVEAMDCVSGECIKTRPEDIGAPNFLRIDFANKAIIGSRRISPIVTVEKSDDQLLLQGQEFGYAWTIALDQESGKLAATLVDRLGVFVLFGSCTPL